jgi:beta-glucanase (GH16 family)
MRRFIAIPLAFLVVFGASSADAQVPNGTPLNLAGFSPTLDITASAPPRLASGVEPWWGPYQLPPRPFSLTAPFLSQGVPPNGAYPAVPGSVTNTSNPSYPAPYWTGYGNELTAYPNADLAFDIAATVGQRGNPMVFTGGLLRMSAQKITPAERATLPTMLSTHTYISGAVNTYPAAQEYGYFEETAKVPAGSGLWASFWLWPENMNLSPCTAAASCYPEIDIFEIMGRQPGIINTTVHTSDHSSSAYPSLTYAYTVPKNINLSLGFHRFGMDWEPDYMTFYLDGVSYDSIKTPADMHQPFFIITGLAVGIPTQWAGPVDSGTPSPAIMDIAALRVWQNTANIK